VENTHDIASALQRLDAALTTGAPILKSTLRPPATEQDLQALRDAIAPWPLPTDLLAYLRWHDGQSDAFPIEWWPTLDAGVLTPVQYMIKNYETFCSKGFMGPWPRGWLPLTQEGWNATALELVPERPAVLISIGVDHRRVIAPSLAAMFHVTADLAENRALIAMSESRVLTAEDPWPGEAWEASYAAIQRATSLRYAGAWRHWRAVKHEHGIDEDQGDHPLYLENPVFYRSVGWS